MPLSAALDLLFPPTCLACEEPATAHGGLCGACWRSASFLSGPVCDLCGAPLDAGLDTRLDAGVGDARLLCDACDRDPPPWSRGRAATLYEGAPRRAILALKHVDRLEAARPMAAWMARAVAPIAEGVDWLAPTPLHWRRRAVRRFNQSAELARALSREISIPVAAGALRRVRATPSQDGKSRAERRRNVRDAFAVTEGWRGRLAGARVLLVDDVMTTGATLAACTEALQAAGAADIRVLVCARVAKRR